MNIYHFKNNTMKSIDTFYNNNFFRSRLEARWAVFFNEAGIKYEYEPEGFKNDAGDKYLPDFYLPEATIRDGDKGVYIEIKPDSFLLEQIPQSTWFDKPLVLFCGTPNYHIWGMFSKFVGGFEQYPLRDNHMGIFKCSHCNHIKIEYHFGNKHYCPNCKRAGSKTKFLLNAAQLAVKKRFEHQEFMTM